jgi:hypothetical protein
MVIPVPAWAQRVGRDRWRRRLLVAWIAFPVTELGLALGDLEPLRGGEALAELLGLAVIGGAHAALAPDDWRGSAAWPGAIGGTACAFRYLHALVRLSHDSLLPAMPFVGLGMLVLAVLLVRFLDRLLWRRIPALLLAAAAPLALRVVLVGPLQTLGLFAPGAAAPSASGPPMVVITVDTLRSDAAAGMHSVARLGARGLSWTRAMSTSSWTWPALVSMWTGLSPSEHGSGREPARRPGMRRWGDGVKLLPEELAAAGYVTQAFTTNPIVALMRLGPAFSRYAHANVIGVPLALAGFVGPSADAGDARDVVDAAIRWLRRAPARGFLLWVHLYEPHLPYTHAREDWLDYNLLRHVRTGHWFLQGGDRDLVRDAYHHEVAYVDREIGRLIEALETRGILDRGVVVLTSDHGEELWEHGGFEHGHSHHGEVVDVPLVLVAPGVAQAARPDLASLVDVAPTLRAIAGLPARGLDLRQPIPSGRVAIAEGNLYHGPMRSYRVGTTRVIIDGDGSRAYDLAADPGEHTPRRLDAGGLRALLGDAAGEREAAAGGLQFQLDDQALRALGYVH